MEQFVQRILGRQRWEDEDFLNSSTIGFFPHQGSPTLTSSFRGRMITWQLSLAQRICEGRQIGNGGILDPDWVGLHIAKEWKTLCLSSHGDSCNNPLKIWQTRPAWVVDVKKRCLVPKSKVDSFVALSYRWGDATGPLVDDELLGKLQTPNCLDDPIISDNIAPTIQHAIYLTSVLNERYLWVDALCINHGSADTAEQLKLMGAIYVNATLTIIAADGAARDGIKGLRGVSGSRVHDLHQTIIPFGENKLLVRNTSYFSLLEETQYYKRGWTYQEHIMAKRKLWFHGFQMHWECQCNQWHEELTSNSRVEVYINPRLQEMLAGFPELGSVSHVVGDYNELFLRYDEDALPAVSGLLSVLGRSFNGGFLYGIPEMYFDRALAWRPQWEDTNLRRRTSSNRPSEIKLSPGGLPSWSWVGWQGHVTMGKEASRINYISPCIEETTPITHWFTGDSPSTPPSSRREIRPFWYKYREAWKDATKPPPTGWHAQTPPHGQEPYLWPHSCGDNVFKHKNYLGSDNGPTDTWFYPFPVSDIEESTQPIVPDQTSYLFCRTQRASV